MSQNIELKIKLETFNDILNILKKYEVQKEAVLKQRDIYYKQKDGLLKLRIYSTNGEVIYYKRDESAKDRVSNYQILNVDPKEAEEFFKYIFETEVEVKKVRFLYLYKNTRIHLDEVEGLGKFLELETVVKGSTEEGIDEFNSVVELLRLDTSKQLKSSYRTILLER
ncbi:MAG: class IV adenylate cyclase [Melioribacteraceae bacterium]|nr:class IV adenylate cyclase [Melioribacteraceae bacterium]